MELNNKTILIVGIISIAILALYFKNNELAAAALGGLVGYLSKDIPTQEENTKSYCIQEARISKIETRLDNKHQDLQEIRDDIQHDQEQIQEILVALTQLTTTLKVLQWVIAFLATIAGSGILTMILK